jgi:hypothetical protein
MLLGAFRGGFMQLFAFALLAVFGIVAAVGNLWIIGLAFSESFVWGLICLFVPGGGLGFVIQNWERARGALYVWLSGVGGFVLVLGALTISNNHADNALPNAPATRATGAAGTPFVTDPLLLDDDRPRGKTPCARAEAPSRGFSRWCCNEAGWSRVAKAPDCVTTYPPQDACDAASYGRTATSVCSSIGTDKRRP